MQHSIDDHCETALDSPYSRDREQAIEALGELYPGAPSDEKVTIAEALRQVSVESSHRQERDMARETLQNCFENDPEPIDGIVVETFTEIGTSAKSSDDRLAAIDALREVYPNLGDPLRDTVGKNLADIAGNATYEDERQRARRRLSDITRIERETGSDDESGGEEAVDYLGQSLSEHLEVAAHDSAEACRQRAEELTEFMAEHPVDDESYEDVREDVEGVIQALEAVGTDGELADDRIERVERIARRVERVYARG